LDGNAGFTSGETFSYGYNWDWMENKDSALLTGRYLAGRYTVSSSDSLQALINKVNLGTQSRVGVEFDATGLYSAVSAGGTVAVCLGNEAYVFGSAYVAGGTFSATTPGTSATSTYVVGATFAGSGLLMSGDFVLTSGQVKQLSAAGYSLSALQAKGFITGSVTASASATKTTAGAALASARQNLSAALNAAWAALASSGSGGMSVISGLTTGFQVGCATVTRNSAGVLNAARAIKNGETLVVKTGVYADSAGNWTTNSAIATVLGLNEIVYNIKNTNESVYHATSSFSFDWTVTSSKKYAYDSTAKAAFTTAGLNPAAGATNPLSFTLSTSSRVSSAEAKNNLLTSAQSALNEMFSGALAIQYSASQVLSTNLNLSAVVASATVGTIITAATAAGTIVANQNFNVHTGIYTDNNGNWTKDANIASAFGLNELVYNFANDGTNVNITATAGANTFNVTGAGFNNATQADTFTMGEIVAGINDSIAAAITAKRGGSTRYALSAGPMANPPYLALSNLNAKTSESVVSPANPLDVNANFGSKNIHVSLDTSDAFNNKASDITVSYIAEYLAQSMTYQLGQRQAANAGQSNGQIVVSSGGKVPDLSITLGDVTVNTIRHFNTDGTSAVTTTITVAGIVDDSREVTMVATSATSAANASGKSNFGAWALASAINHNKNSQFWAMVQSFDSNSHSADMVYIFTKEGGNFNDLLACDVAGSDSASRSGLEYVNFENVQNAEMHEDGTTFTLGGEKWAQMKPTQTKAHLGNQVWNLTLEGRDVGLERDLWIANAKEIITPALNNGIINGMDRNSFVEIQNAADSPWAGGEIRTQSTAQAALDAITESINTKDKIRADLGALQNRLENTMTNLTVQSENLQASESRISDVDVATEMTEFTRNNVLSQAATSMLAQANSLSQLALSLIR
jgi:flagellin-like hook-associated protein FlgL